MNLLSGTPRLIFCAAILACTATAAEPKARHFSEWTLGETISGDKVDIADTKGKVVVLEYWGVRCPPCIASLPHLAKLDKRYRDDGLILIGAESQNHSKQQIEPILKKAKVEYTITIGADGPINLSGIPRILVFNRAGIMVYDGHPNGREFERAVKSALKEAPPSAAKPLEKKPANLIEQQQWTNSEGNAITAAVQKADDRSVTFVMPDGRSVIYPLEKLSEESRNTIQKAAAK